MVDLKRFELSTSRLQGGHSPLELQTHKWYSCKDSNLDMQFRKLLSFTVERQEYIGASRGIRTHNLMLTRQLPYQLGQGSMWYPIRDSNPEETDFESAMSANCINRINGVPEGI